MATHDAAGMLPIINNAMEDVHRRSHCKKGKRLQGPLSRELLENASLAKVDPWHLPSKPFIMIKDDSYCLRTRSGYWKEKEDEFTAIHSLPSRSPPYSGVRRTLRFYLKEDDDTETEGTETGWFIHEYQQLDADRSKRDLFLQEDLVIRKVSFRKRTYHRQAPSHYLRSFLESFQTRLSEDLESWMELNSIMCGLFGGTEQFKNALARITTKAGMRGCKAGSSGCGEVPTASAAPNLKSNVWQHFTKIYTKDPKVVYAACHSCDSVLKAHSKNGTTHLERHRLSKKCSCSNNPSLTADQEILHELRATLDLYNQEKREGKLDSPDVNAGLTELDPWNPQLTACYVTSSLNRKTHHGIWEEINDKRTAIRIGQLPVPQYVGLKRTLEFHHHDGTKKGWIMLEYQQVQIDVYKAPDLFLEGALVVHKVFQLCDDVSAVREFAERLNGDDSEEECDNGVREEEVKACMSILLHECVLGEGVQGGPGKRKRQRIWLHFTKIYTTDPERVYAVCHCCDRVYKAHPKKHGISHLKRHNKACSSKHRKV